MPTTSQEISFEEMVKAGVHLGHHTSKWHPKMKEFIFTSKSSIHIINLEQTEVKLKEALDFIYETVYSGKDILFVSTKRQAVPIVRATAEATDMPFMVKRWVGGIFTNFKTITKRIRQLVNLEEKLATQQLAAYTKKERKVFKDKVDKGNKIFAGMKQVKNLPGAIFVEDVVKDALAIKEARDMKIPVIALVDTNANPDLIDYIIPANDDAISSINYFYTLVRKVIDEAKSARSLA